MPCRSEEAICTRMPSHRDCPFCGDWKRTRSASEEEDARRPSSPKRTSGGRAGAGSNWCFAECRLSPGFLDKETTCLVEVIRLSRSTAGCSGKPACLRSWNSFAWTYHEIANMNAEEYCARVLGLFCQAGGHKTGHTEKSATQ